ncbi:MAG: type II toxin-antitoxin system HicB family antitoxin [Treponema sp.]|nr:type II toxin-antitoxin system HicB family antitoxin [Treponema sp.]MCL2251177.1 type II toxin-antitoxin system HicB family antitoxin [Treponema sp.]
MKKITYFAVFEKTKTGFSVYFPDVPGCITCGDDFEHSMRMAQEVLGLHLYGLEKDSEPFPQHTDNIPKLESGDIVAAVSVFPALVKDEIENRREKTNVTIPHWLKVAAEAEGLNYSRLLENAIKETLGIAS